MERLGCPGTWTPASAGETAKDPYQLWWELIHYPLIADRRFAATNAEFIVWHSLFSVLAGKMAGTRVTPN